MKAYKVLAAVMAMVLCLCLGACGGNQEGIDFTLRVEDTDGNVMHESNISATKGISKTDLVINTLSIAGLRCETSKGFITAIGDLAQTDDFSYYWSMYVNGEYAMELLDDLDLKDGDVLLFRYEANSYMA